MKNLLHDSSSRIESSSRSEAEVEENDVLDVQKLNKIKKKSKSKNSVYKKNVMTRAEKKTIKFTERDFSDFEIVEQTLEQRKKRVKKNTEVNNSTERDDRNERDDRDERRERERNRNERDEAASIRKKTLREKSIEIFSDSENENFESNDDFNNLDNDEKFVDSKAKEESNELNTR